MAKKPEKLQWGHGMVTVGWALTPMTDLTEEDALQWGHGMVTVGW